jgi:diacylglycerol kinase family enzyme
LFIINPVATRIKGKLSSVTDSIHAFFREYPHIEYNTHITRWERDALGIVMRYAKKADELLRIHIMGGTGTLFEVVNAVVGMPNIQLSLYPLGYENCFLRYFGKKNIHLFSSIRTQVFSGAIQIDAFRFGYNYGINCGLIGLEAYAYKEGADFLDKNTFFPNDLVYLAYAGKLLLNKHSSQAYKITLDDVVLDGTYISIHIANGRCYGKNMEPASNALLNDGLLDFYLIKNVSMLNFPAVSRNYLSGNANKLQGKLNYYRGKKITISSESPMCISVDGQIFYDNLIDFEIMPYAIDLVCPSGIDVDSLIPIPFTEGVV